MLLQNVTLSYQPSQLLNTTFYDNGNSNYPTWSKSTNNNALLDPNATRVLSNNFNDINSMPLNSNSEVKDRRTCNNNQHRNGISTKTKNSPLVKCQLGLLQELQELKDKRVLSQSLIHGTEEFEVLEFYGDSLMAERITHNLIKTKRFMNPHLLTQMRTYIVNNGNLAAVFDNLRLFNLLDKEQRRIISRSVDKRKADIVEAIIGEMSEVAENHSLSSQINSTRQRLISFICSAGESAYYSNPSNQLHVSNSSNQLHASRGQKFSDRDSTKSSSYDQLAPPFPLPTTTLISSSETSDRNQIMSSNQYQQHQPVRPLEIPIISESRRTPDSMMQGYGSDIQMQSQSLRLNLIPASPIIRSPESQSPPSSFSSRSPEHPTINLIREDPLQNRNKIFVTEILPDTGSGGYFSGQMENYNRSSTGISTKNNPARQLFSTPTYFQPLDSRINDRRFN